MAPAGNDPAPVSITTTVDEDMLTEVIRAVAACSNREPEDLPSLAHVIDPDALDALFEPKPDGTPRAGGTLTFSYAGYEVRISGNQEVAVTPFVDWR